MNAFGGILIPFRNVCEKIHPITAIFPQLLRIQTI